MKAPIKNVFTGLKEKMRFLNRDVVSGIRPGAEPAPPPQAAGLDRPRDSWQPPDKRLLT